MQDMTLRISAAIVIILMLAGCGGGGGPGPGSSNALIEQQVAEEARKAAEAARKAEEARKAEAERKAAEAAEDRDLPGAPMFNTVHSAFLGRDSRVDGLTAQPTYREFHVRSGRVRDGEPGARVSAYLNALASYDPDYNFASSLADDGNKYGLAAFTSRPVLRIAEGTSAEHRRLTLEAVARVNAALPWGRRILIGDPAPAPPPGANAAAVFTWRDIVDEIENVDGQISVDFAAFSEARIGGRAQLEYAWECGYDECYHRAADAERHWKTKGMRAARVVIDHSKYAGRRNAMRDTLMHELVHALGLSGHPPKSRFPDSMMPNPSDPQPFLYLPAIDADALWAAYTRFDIGTESFESLGPWTDTSFHLRADSEDVGAFGVGIRNGLARPWAFGPMPNTDLADNRALSGSATWNGVLLGFTPEAHTVAGAARIGVDLSSLAGHADFTELESFGVRASPGAPGTGTQWLDGDLGYTIAVRGNVFQETGGDAGTLSGHFTGGGHEGAVGTLERRDLSAAFGAERQ
jgi:hypothetical protein